MRKKEYGLWHDISWNEYYRRAKYVGSALISMGLKRGECVSIIGDNCPEWVIIDLGIQGGGGVAVGVYATNAWPQVEYVIDHSESRFFFVENEEQLDKWLHFRDKVPSLKKVIVWDLEGLRHFEDPLVMTYQELLEQGREVAEKEPDLYEKRMDAVVDSSILWHRLIGKGVGRKINQELAEPHEIQPTALLQAFPQLVFRVLKSWRPVHRLDDDLSDRVLDLQS